MFTVALSGEVSWRRRYVGCSGEERLGASWVIDYRTGSSRWVWGTAKSLEFQAFVLVVLGRILWWAKYQDLGLSIVGYLIPVCALAFVGFINRRY